MRRNQGRGRRGRGFTLTEVMIAVLILGFGMAVFGAVFPATSQAISRSRHLDLATDACQQQLEAWRAAGYDALPPPASGMASISQSFTPPASLPSATGSVTFTRVDSSFAASAASTGRARVDVTVTWTGRGPDRGSATLTAVLFPPLAGQ